MLSLTFFSPYITFSPQPSLLTIKPLKSPKDKHNSETRNTGYHNDRSSFHCFSNKTPSSTSHCDNSSDIVGFQHNPDADSSDTGSVSQCVDSNELAVWLQRCNSVKQVKRIHAIALKCLSNSVTYVDNNLISVYVKFGKLIEARKVFDKMLERNVVSWTAMVNGYLKFGFDDEALRLFSESIRSVVRANGKMFVCVMNLCSRKLDLVLGRQIHACVVKGNWRNLIVDSAILHFYAQLGELSCAFRAFDGMSERDVVSWTTIITACSQQGQGDEAFLMFSRMLIDGFLPNEFTACSVLKACAEEKALKFGRQLHGAIVKKTYNNDVYIGTSLVDMYAKCGEILDSRKVFDEMMNRNTVTWTSIIAGYARKGLGEEAINLFRVMKRRKIIANKLTIVSILRACGLIGAVQTGMEVHAQIIKNCIQTNVYIGSTLVWFYCKSGESPTAYKVLQQMPLRDVVSWTAMISGCASLGHESEALDFLKDMLEEGVEPNPFTYSSVLKACAMLEDITHGKLIHSSVKKTTAFSNVFVGSALINMYAKCGYVLEASQVFDSMPERNLFAWKSMIVAYARNGLCQEALKLMYRMQAEGFEVDDYILTTVYNACGDIEWDMELSSGCCLQSS
ncbi:pentatricopeptide repeat-containing protein At4g18520, chloroplastic-like [Pistacia vera]|uniref:pentatricopeptide repeat-containing protein At4g18520, chloroplastic-like n=1 Tax=Pistacia vera TaxID=55513 RepID=UPI001262CB5A|nr:pentatricopeptide repeat-containing protein At4g18520, chloroplastic-like [Pistacia vera]